MTDVGVRLGGGGMRPMVRPALRRAWRDLRYVQFGVAPAHAVVVGPVDTATGSLLELLDGTRGVPALREEARGLGVPDDWLDGLLTRLAGAGLLEDTAAGAGSGEGPAGRGRMRRAAVPDRLRADLGSLSVVHRGPGEPARRLAARGAMRVQVRGAGRVGAAVAALLSAAGVGQVDVLDGGRVRPWDVAPGGLPPESVGERRDVAARRLVARSAPRASGAAGVPGGPEPALSLVVVAPRDGLAAYAPDPAGAGAWVETGTPHLFAGVLEATGVVGPLVLPGETACARCVESHRVDADPAWPRLLAQWRSGRRGGAVPTGDVGLAAAVSGLAAAHALAFLDGAAPASAGARWEVSSPLLEWWARRLRPHEECPCGAADRAWRAGEGADRERPSGVREGQDTMAG